MTVALRVARLPRRKGWSRRSDAALGTADMVVSRTGGRDARTDSPDHEGVQRVVSDVVQCGLPWMCSISRSSSAWGRQEIPGMVVDCGRVVAHFMYVAVMSNCGRREYGIQTCIQLRVVGHGVTEVTRPNVRADRVNVTAPIAVQTHDYLLISSSFRGIRIDLGRQQSEWENFNCSTAHADRVLSGRNTGSLARMFGVSAGPWRDVCHESGIAKTGPVRAAYPHCPVVLG